MSPALVVVHCVTLVAFVATAGSHAQSGQTVPSSPEARQTARTDEDRAARMRYHFALVMDVHDAVVRGDLEVAQKHARALADAPDPPGLPAAAGPYVFAMHRAAGRAASEDDLDEVGAAAAAMLAACGDCHRAVGTMPVIPGPVASAVGGKVGHMLEHKRAVDLMAQGLVAPSTSTWRQGATALQAAPLRGRDLPRDPKLTREIREFEERVHELAERGKAAADTRSRIYVYGEVIESCGACHSLHANVWGPDR